MELLDIGANLTHASFKEDVSAVIERARHAGVSRMVVTGTTIQESYAALALSSLYKEQIFCTAGVHPHHARDCNDETIPALRKIAQNPAVKAIGECGLDFNRNYSPHPDQEKWFVAQLHLGIELGKPLFLHSRDAFPRFSDILRNEKPPKAVAHCFTGEREELHAYLDLGLYIGITGWICDERRGKHLLDLAKEIPRERLLLETDSPYLTPRDMKPQPKSRRNEPAFLPHIARAVARAVGRPVEEIASETTRNAIAFFGLNESRASTAEDRPLAA